MTRALVLLLTFATGFAGLANEVVWQRYGATLLGSHAAATSAVLGIFLGGLAAGYALFGAWARRLVAVAARRGRPPRLLLVYAAVEAAIGLHALLFPALFRVVREGAVAIPALSPAAAFAADVALTALLIGPATVLMGATIPMLSQALARNLAEASRLHAAIYAANTAGAFVGALAAGFFLIGKLGLAGTLTVAGLVDLTAALLLAAVALGGAAAPAVLAARGTAAGEASAPPSPGSGTASYLAVAALSGFAMMALQIVVVRLGGLAFGSSPTTFASVVAVFVLSIALGSLAVSLWPRPGPRHLVASQAILLLLLVLLYTPLQDAPWAAWQLRLRFGQTDADFLRFQLAGFAALLAVLVVPLALSGALLPLLFHHLRRELGGLGALAGRLYAWNTLGSLAGALLAGHVLLHWLDLHHVYRASLLALACAVALLVVRVQGASPRGVAVAVLVPALGAVLLLEPWRPARLSSGLFRLRPGSGQSALPPELFFDDPFARRSILFHDDDPTSSVAVVDNTRPDEPSRRALVVNGKSDGEVPTDDPTMVLAGILPALFAGRAERAFVIGLGAGVTASELAALDECAEVVVAEISPAVIAAAPHFAFRAPAPSRAELRIVAADAYRTLRRSQRRFDVIASEPSNPWVSGVEMLYSREFLEAARDRLAPGGVYAQWLHAYEADAETLALVLRSFDAAFPQASLWYALGADLLLLGFVEPVHALDVARLETRAAQPDFRAALGRAGIDDFPSLLAHELWPLGVLRAAVPAGPFHTLDHPRLAEQAVRAFFRGATAELPPSARADAARLGREHSLLRRLAGLRGGALPAAEREQALRETCRHRQTECGALLAAWRHDEPRSPRLAGLLTEFARSPAAVDELASLFSDDGPAALFAGSPAAARRATELFLRFHHHAAPFDPEALRAQWRHCEDGPDEAGGCAAGRRQVAGLLGDPGPAGSSPAAGILAP